MSTIQAPEWVLRKSVGSMGIDPELGIFLRVEGWGPAAPSRNCRPDPRLVAWEMNHTLAVICLVRLSGDIPATYETWIEMGSSSGLASLKYLAQSRQLAIHLVTDKVERRLAIPNLVQRNAMDIYRRGVSGADVWRRSDYDRIVDYLGQRYPTTRDLWRAALAKSLYVIE
ncbi:MAG: hypothetical protein JXO22_11780 [Phycisphaerae bacterium]|nr:hypothetical protein [Phycisphaerae bacterium]